MCGWKVNLSCCYGNHFVVIIDVTKGVHIIASAWWLHDVSKMDVDYFVER